MGFDIEAVDSKGNIIAEHRAYMGGFRMMTEQGYDWFELIDAYDCYGGVSGNGTEKEIKLSLLNNALKVLLEYNPKRLSSEGTDEFNSRKPRLREFMEKCIKYCEDNNKDSILIGFY